MEVQNLKVCDITPSAMNPRKTFDKDSLAELAENIKNQGLLQPITVRPVPEEASVKINKDGTTSEFKYEIVCGERRFRACKMNGAEYILGIVREMSDEEAYDAMITENLQRRDVDPIEEAFAFSELMREVRKNNVAELVRKVKELEDIQSDVDSEVRKTFEYTAHDGGLEPFEEIALSAIMIKNTNNLATKFFNKDSWQIKDEEVIAFVEQHKDMLAAIMTSYLKQQLEAYTYSGFRKYVLEHTQPGTYEEIEGRVRTSHQKRIDGYVAQLEELGYDKDGNPIEKEAQ